MVIRVCAEEVTEEFGVGRRVAGPHVPHSIAQGIGNEFVFRSFHDVVGTNVGRLCVRIVRGVKFLRGEQAEMFAPEHSTEGGGVVTCFVGLTVHGAVQVVLIFHDDRKLAVVETHL